MSKELAKLTSPTRTRRFLLTFRVKVLSGIVWVDLGCEKTVEALADSLGPASREYLAVHIAATDEGIQKAVTALKEPRQTPK